MTKQEERRENYKNIIDKWDLHIAESLTLRGRGLFQYYLRMDNYNRAEQILNDPLFWAPIEDSLYYQDDPIDIL